ncbi:MAG TPA: sugar O-acetyltransferase [Gemmatimonadaceae bacterium]|jgi:maltose O-acetyltransferase|nr:sugar O-acetyltransferase [Gemmatimonadaceae bacterium]
MSVERERMLRGEAYDTRDPALLAAAHRSRALLAEFAATASTDLDARRAILGRLLGGVGDEVWIEPPFFCDYGENVYIGDRTFVNVNCVFLDSAEIRIGANGLLAPAVQLLTATHPLRAADRMLSAEARAGRSPFRTFARPITIGDNVWIGAGTLVLPGVTIGDDVTIGAGSVVTSDVPSGTLAYGHPARVQRTL